MVLYVSNLRLTTLLFMLLLSLLPSFATLEVVAGSSDTARMSTSSMGESQNCLRRASQFCRRSISISLCVFILIFSRLNSSKEFSQISVIVILCRKSSSETFREVIFRRGPNSPVHVEEFKA